MLNAPEDQKKALEMILKARTIPIGEGEDVLRWSTSVDGMYKVKIRYKLKERWEEGKIWPNALLWGKNVLPKVGVFTWSTTQGRRLTHDRLIKLGFRGPSRCIMCKQQAETMSHLLLSCPYAEYC